MRKGLKFHNGTPVTAQDIVHSMRRTRKDPQSKQTQNISAVASEKALNDYTVQSDDRRFPRRRCSIICSTGSSSPAKDSTTNMVPKSPTNSIPSAPGRTNFAS